MASDEPVQGLQALLRSMEGLLLSLRKTLIVRALRKGGQIIMKRAQELAPRDPRTPGNRIPDSMHVRVKEQTATGAIAEIGPTKKGFAGIFAEVGTVKQRAKPWLAPAFDQTEEQAWAVIEQELGDSIEREFEKV